MNAIALLPVRPNFNVALSTKSYPPPQRKLHLVREYSQQELRDMSPTLWPEHKELQLEKYLLLLTTLRQPLPDHILVRVQFLQSDRHEYTRLRQIAERVLTAHQENLERTWFR